MECGRFHMHMMGLLLDRYGSDQTFRNYEQDRFDIDFYEYQVAVIFGIVPQAYFDFREARGIASETGKRHCKRCELVIDGHAVAAEYVYDDTMGGFVCDWVTGKSYYDLPDETKVKLTILMSEYD